MVSIWFGLVSYLYCTDGYSADTFKFLSFLIHEVLKIGPARTPETHNPIILSRWLWTTFGNVTNSLSLFYFSFNSSAGIRTNTSLNQQCPTVVVIMKPSLMPTSFIKETCSRLGPRVPSVRKYDANHGHSARQARGKLLFALGVFSKNTIKK